MVRVFESGQGCSKGSIEYLIHHKNGSSTDGKSFASYYDQGQSRSSRQMHSRSYGASNAGVDHLLNAASLLRQDPNSASISSSDVSSHTKYESSGGSETSPSRSDVQSARARKRKRKEIKCDQCGRTFGDSSSLRKHHRVVHLKIKEFACEHCGKTFAEKSNRSKHIIAAHRNERSHHCPECNKPFNFTDGLRRHMNNVHLGLRPYHCELCNTSYKQKTHLLKHQQSVHNTTPLEKSKS